MIARAGEGNRLPWWARAAAALASLPLSLRVVLALAAVLHGVGLSWGMPASDGWDNDGIAPRDILPGVAATFTPGDYYTYPPAHLLLLTLLTLPVTATAVVNAGSMRVPDVVREILAPRYMTAFAMMARIVALLMSLGVAITLAKIAEELCKEDRARAERAGTLTAAIASFGVSLTYYAHTSNLDLPSLFWGSLAALALVRALARREPRRLRHMAALAALAIATKDQTYALFVVSVPVLLVTWLLVDRWARANVRQIAREAFIAFGIGAAMIAVLDGAVFNPSGFRARLAFLSGPASQDFTTYSKDFAGRVAIILDIGRQLHRHYPPIFGALIVFGAALAVRTALRAQRSSVVAAFVPVALAISFTLAFNFAARRTEDRFTLPHYLFAAVYAGVGMERLWSAAKRPSWRLLARSSCIALLALAVWEALRVDLTLLFEPRYAAEAFLSTAARPGDLIETHGINVYLPRFPEHARVIRVGPTPVSRRGPLPGVTEVQAPFMEVEARRPRFIVVSKCYAWRYLVTDTRTPEGRVYPPGQEREAADVDATSFFQGLFAGRLGYRVAHVSVIQDRWFDPIEIHASTNCRVTTFERSEERP